MLLYQAHELASTLWVIFGHTSPLYLMRLTILFLDSSRVRQTPNIW